MGLAEPGVSGALIIGAERMTEYAESVVLAVAGFAFGAALAFLEDAVRATGALAAFGGDAEMLAQSAHGVDTVADGFTHLSFGYGMADTNVHGFLHASDESILFKRESLSNVN